MCTWESNNKKKLPHWMKWYDHVSSPGLKAPNLSLFYFIRNVPILFILYAETNLSTVRTAEDRQCNCVSLQVYSNITNFNLVQNNWLLTTRVALNWFYHLSCFFLFKQVMYIFPGRLFVRSSSKLLHNLDLLNGFYSQTLQKHRSCSTD